MSTKYYLQSWFQNLPSGWISKKIKFGFNRIGSGTTPPSGNENYYGGEYAWVTTSELRENIVTSTNKTLTQYAIQELSALQFYPKGSLLFAMYGATIGRLGILGVPATVNQAVCVLSEPSTLNTKFTFYAFQASREYLQMLASGGGQPNLNSETVRDHKIPCPDLSTQHRIALYLDNETSHIDALISSKERLLSILAEKRIALITRTVIGGLDSGIKTKKSGVEWLGEVPEHWEVSRLRWLYSKIEQGWSPQSEGIEPGENEWGVLKLNAVKIGDFDDTKCKALPIDSIIPTNLEVKTGDFLITRANTPSLVGDVCYVKKTRSKLILSDLIYRLHLDNEKVDGEFLNFFLLTVGRVQIEADARGTSNSMVKISQEHIANWIVALPPREEQLAIVEFIGKVISKLDALRTANIRSIELLKERRAALISAAVTGQIEITD